MADYKTCVLSIAGFDPSGGAGLLADVKTFDTNNVMGMGVMSALTFQNDIEFDEVNWIAADDIIKQISVLQRRFYFGVVKIGLIKDLNTLAEIITWLKSSTPNIFIIWDPILEASAGFKFHLDLNYEKLFSILSIIDLITPNTSEAKILANCTDAKEGAAKLSRYCNVLLKGGHDEAESGVDYLFNQNQVNKIKCSAEFVFAKHGSGCVLSSAIAAELIKGNDLLEACTQAKIYVERFLISNQSLLGTHHV